ncbi:MAG: nucleoside hydrolase [Sphaerobacter sp.]|nr:nucleoside hydrolase [Sphaerobacter sp.]
MSGGRIPILLDVDTGVDDAMAIALALRLDAVELVGVTTVAGNVTLEHTTENTRRVLAWLGAPEIPVARGMSRPLVRPLRTAAWVHGDTGLGGFAPPPSPVPLSPVTAPEFMVRTARERPGEVVFVCVGPLTNLAVALGLEPDLPRLVRRVVIMGGAFTVPGNVTPAAEFNVYVDPESAAAVARSALPITFIGLDVTHQVALLRTEWERLGAATDPAARLVRGVGQHSFARRGIDQMHLHDPLAVAVAACPNLVRTRATGVAIDTGLGARAGETMLVERPGLPTHDVALEVDAAAFGTLFRSALRLEVVAG